jgi:DNA-binding NarL/FixJ family response regulator
MQANNISIIIVDDHPVVTEGLRALLEKKSNLDIIGCFTTAAETLQFLADRKADVVLLDISLPDANGADVCLRIKTLYPSTCILAISNHNERSIIAQMLQNGASGYLLKNSSAEELTRSILSAIEGNLALSQEVQLILAQSDPSFRQAPRLTRREKEVLKWVAEGLTTGTIAEKLFISPLTVETHRRNLMQKFEVNNTAALVKIAMEQKLL